MTVKQKRGLLKLELPPMKNNPLRLTLRECVLLGLLCLSLGLCAFLAGERRAWRSAAMDQSHQLAPPFVHPPTTGGPE